MVKKKKQEVSVEEITQIAEQEMRKKGKGTCQRCSVVLPKDVDICPVCGASTSWKN